MKNHVIFLLISFAILSCQGNKNTDKKDAIDGPTSTDSLTIELEALHREGTINGFGVAIVNQDTTLYANGFGYADMDKKVGYTRNTLQNVASVSKTLIGISLLKAQEMGVLNLDDPINKYLPFKTVNPYYPEDVITLTHLATHTSSIQDGYLYGELSYILKNAEDAALAKSISSSEGFNLPDTRVAMGTFLKKYLSTEGEWYQKAHFLENRPGTLYEYTNVGATLAAYIIEVVTGMTYATFTQKHILEPLQMSSTGWTWADIDTTKMTHLFTVDGKRIPDYSLITYPDGGLITSVSDKAKYLSELIRGYSGEGKIVTKDSYELFFSAFLSEKNFEEERDTDRPFDDEYNSGLFVGHTPIGYIGHMGGDPGVSTFMFFNPKTKIGKLLFVNTDLDQKGADQFYAIWDLLGAYETKLNEEL